MEVFELKDVFYLHPGERPALSGVSFSVKDGESLTILGANGSGKSTLLFLLDGLITPRSGMIKAFGRDIGNGLLPELRQRVSILFQNPQVQLFSLTVWDELCFGPIQLGLVKEEVTKRAEDVLHLLGIEHLQDRGPWNLSGGEMKKVALGTCLITNPDVILLDEPTTGLDPRSQVEFIELINSLRDAKKTVITATHDLDIIEDISEKTIVFGENHRIIAEARPYEVINDTGLLLDANLIHAHAHKHREIVHSHGHYSAHSHEHLMDRIMAESPGSPKTSVSENEIERLRILLDHWIEHSESHRDSYISWAEKMEGIGRADVAEVLRKASSETQEVDKLFRKAKAML